jgi:hypothetical protein
MIFKHLSTMMFFLLFWGIPKGDSKEEFPLGFSEF